MVHLAWGFQPTHREDYLAELGVGGTRRVIGAAVSAGVPHLVHMSSVGAYSPKQDDTPVDESWPTRGVTSSMYSRHKAAAERLLDDLEAEGSGPVVTRLRPGIVGQESAGSALLRYGLPSLVPRGLLFHVPVLPLDRRLAIPMVHADDLAEATVLALESLAPGPFNVAATPAITAEDIALVLALGWCTCRRQPCAQRSPRAGTPGCSPWTPDGSTWPSQCPSWTRRGHSPSWAGHPRQARARFWPRLCRACRMGRPMPRPSSGRGPWPAA